MEYLRHVAGAQGADARDLVHESAWALGAMASDPQALVLIVRRLVDKHPTCAPLWWLGSQVLASTEPAARLHELTAVYADDPTDMLLEEYLGGLGEAGSDEVGPIVEALGCGTDDGRAEVLVNADSDGGAGAVLVVRRGTVLPRDLWRAMKDRAPAGTWIVEPSRFPTIVGPFGVVGPEHLDLIPECGPCPELLVASGL
jgi:hypothetical protein